ncbi:MAG TPA: hypothetical protein VM492_18745, partial [Sumerlaeia bacterium]|nr:hypothetical protein [Sumerlaeia bacterium]
MKRQPCHSPAEGIPASWSRRGAAGLMVVVVIGIILVGLAGGMTSLAVHQTRDRARYELYKDEFAAAEEGLNKAFGHVQFLVKMGAPDYLEKILGTTPPVVAGYSFPMFRVTPTFSGIEAETEGQWAGMTLNRRRYRVDVTALKTTDLARGIEHSGVALRQTLEVTYIPLYNYAIFYDPIMEIAPGPAMDVIGRVHANGDMYVQSNSGLTFRKQVTA